MSTQQIRFFHRGELVEVSGAQPTRTVLEWLREDARCTGTKEGCNEGDCGACTVVIGELPEHTDAPGTSVRGLSLRTVNACIQFLPTLHGKALFTVEDLKGTPSAGLHPAQQAMVECHGSQCGFCTPGFMMSLWSTYEHHAACGTRPSRQQLADDLAGNLCRCTGYRPILDAGQRMFELPATRLDTAPVIDALRSIDRSDTFSRPGFHAPRSLAALATLREQLPAARLLAGSTDVGLWVNKQFKELGEIIYVGDVDELKGVEERDGELYLGAGASLESTWRALAARWPELTDVWLRFASPPIRHAGTMGGNVANGSPIGDAPPVLMSLDAQIELRRGERVRRMPLADFYVDYMKNRLEPGEFVQGLAVPPMAARRQVRAYKISKRFDSDISAVCAGLSIELDGDTVKQVRLAYGGMAAIVKRAPQAEAAVQGQPWTQATVDAAKAALARDFTPLTDMRASAAYRLQVALNLLQRFWLETRRTNPLPIQATSVWSVMPHDVTEGA
ncbi:xanthine dehydrogenase small subunit [Piscinibacter sp.]|jgi:xanthine dehydrogenase small subunit|uniref:xanthine dehydrogenase small subunit n=1 Tax=Piscinibacter sp. TaxID=1903157 RepID=UPI0035598592